MNWTSLISFLKSFMKLPDITNMATVREWLQALCTFLIQLTKLTSVTVDDDLVRLLQAVLGDDAAFQEFYTLLLDVSGQSGKLKAGEEFTITPEQAPALAHRCEAGRINWANLIALATKIAEIVLPLVMKDGEQ